MIAAIIYAFLKHQLPSELGSFIDGGCFTFKGNSNKLGVKTLLDGLGVSLESRCEVGNQMACRL